MEESKGWQEKDMNLIRKLPELLISNNILTHLSTKDAIKTSALSTEWRDLWKSVPLLDLDSRHFSNLNDFVSFIDKFFVCLKESWIHKLRLKISEPNDGTKSHLSSWIDAVTKRRVQKLDIRIDDFIFEPFYEIPMSIYTCKTLVQLRLSCVTLVNAEFVSLPCLKIMHLEGGREVNEVTTMEKLISGSPVLEDLTIIRYPSRSRVLQVRSETLKRIQINSLAEVVIYAPLLKCLEIEFIEKKNYKIISLGFPVKLDIDVIPYFTHPGIITDKRVFCDILTDISKVRELVIGGDMWEEIYLYSKSEPLLQFRHLSRLRVTYFKSDLELLPTFLESCPNLESLTLKEPHVMFKRQKEEKEPNVVFSAVPRCLISSLKFVKFKRSKWISEYEGEM